MVELGLTSPISRECEDVRIKKDNIEVIFDFRGDKGYTGEPNIKFIVAAVDFDEATKKLDKYGLPYIEKIMMVNRIRLTISQIHFILEGAKGHIERSCFVSKLWRGGSSFYHEHFSQQRIDAIINTEFKNLNEKALGYFRFAMFSTTDIDQFRNLRLALESLIPKRDDPKVRKCEKCAADLYCKKCAHVVSHTGVLDEDIRGFWIDEMHGDKNLIDEILKLRHKAFHASPISSIYKHKLPHINHKLEIGLGFYFSQGTQFVPMMADHGRNYYSKLTFETSFPDQEFPEDFPKEDYWREKILTPPDDG